MKYLLVVISSLFFIGSVQGQFNLFVSSSTTQSVELFIPSGAGEKYLLLLDRDSLRIDSIGIDNCSMGCLIPIQDLSPSTIYLTQLYRNNTLQEERWIITSSTSTGLVEVYFTNDVDSRQSNGSAPVATEGAILEAAIVQAIQQAHSTIDVMLYNINRRPISNALIAAHNRGVRVRYVTSDNTANTALTAPVPDFPILIGNLGAGLMHNKVFIIDANDPDRALVITGATNMTTNQIYTDHNNTLFIQDKSIAKVYEKEMDEMWGSTSALPNVALSRFGSQKRDDTPHEVYVNGRLFEVYFSPSDNTTFHIVNALNSAQYDCFFSLLLITRSNLAATLINLKNRGVDVKGLVNNQNENGTEFFNLQSNGVFLLQYSGSRQLHHKYAIVDAGALGDSPKLITGSHNWSNNAENRNDENTLIIHDPNLVNIFFQEFQARWCEVFNGQDCLLATSLSTYDLPDAFYCKVHYHKESGELLLWPSSTVEVSSISIWNAGGQMIYGRSARALSALSEPSTLHVPGLMPGSYVLVVTTKDGQRWSVSFLV